MAVTDCGAVLRAVLRRQLGAAGEEAAGRVLAELWDGGVAIVPADLPAADAREARELAAWELLRDEAPGDALQRVWKLTAFRLYDRVRRALDAEWRANAERADAEIAARVASLTG